MVGNGSTHISCLIILSTLSDEMIWALSPFVDEESTRTERTSTVEGLTVD